MPARLGLLLALALAGPAQAQDLTAQLERDPVFVAPSRAADLPVDAQGRVRLAILRADIGRIKVAVVPPGDAQAIAARVDLPGAVLVVAGDELGVTGAAGARRAFAGRGSLEERLLRTVRSLRVAGSGGGPGVAEPGVVTTPALPQIEEITETVSDGLRLAFIAVFAVVAGVFLLVAFVFWRNLRAAREEHEDVAEDLAAAIEEERTRLGEDIVDLDVPTGMPGADPGARAAYERALDAYEKSALALQRADTHRRLEAVRRLVADGRAEAARARSAVGG